MRRAPLDPGRVDAYLARLGVPEPRLDAAGLACLQAAHLMAVPFHNLLLLENDGQPWDLQPLSAVVDDAIAGVGGNCDRTTPPFCALLQTLGYDARLVAATVREPGDHFAAIVHLEGARFLCDVGNGHPYLRPWDLDGPAVEQSFHGWRFRFDPRARAGPTLLRALPDGGYKTVYVVDPRPRAYEDFAPMVAAHYTRAGFGPFLTGLRAVRVQAEAVLTLRDAEYGRDTRFGRSTRRVRGREALAGLLVERFLLPERLVDGALDALGRRRPDLLEEPRWFALGRGLASQSAGVAPPPREEVPDVIVSLATVGRQTALRRLLDTLAEERRASGYPGRVGVLIVENHPETGDLPGADPPGLVVHRLRITGLAPELARASRLGVLPSLGDLLPLPIGAAREAQLAALRRHLDAPLGGLPHPAQHPVVVWMVDDDVAFQQLDASGQLGRHANLLFRVARYWSALPQRAVAIGNFTGDPPVPGPDCLSGQLGDLCLDLRRMVGLGPEAPWEPPPAPPPSFDAYYDLTEAAGPDPEAAWPYAPQRAGQRVAKVALGLLGDLPRLLDGQQLTRPLSWDGTDMAPRPSLRRGGNALFLDIDALFRWPTPVLQTADGVLTRRADTLWAALARAEDPGAVVEATLPLLHGREGQAGPTEQPPPSQAARACSAQVRGVVLARAVAEGRPVALELPAREARVRAQRREVLARLAELRGEISRLRAWGDPIIDNEIDNSFTALDALERLVRASQPDPGDPDELQTFLTDLPAAVAAWRGAW